MVDWGAYNAGFTSFGSLYRNVAGSLAAYVETMPLYSMFGSIAAVLIGAAVVMFALTKPVKRLMGEA